MSIIDLKLLCLYDVEKDTTMTTVGIIGFSGRNGDLDRAKLTPQLYNKMCDLSAYIIKTEFKVNLDDITVISGGSSISDHIAVVLFNQGIIKQLKLCLPCEFDCKRMCFDESKECGRTLNGLHREFSSRIGISSLEEIGLAIKNNCEIEVYNGFFSRNNVIAATAKYLLAFGITKSDINKKSGGTAYTYDKCRGTRKFIYLH